MDEYISREEALEAIRYRVCQGQGNKEHICKRGSCAYCGIMEIMNDILSIEAADVQPVKHGMWIYQSNNMWLCSCCKENLIYSETETDRVKKQRYCSRCGARMDR